MYLNIKKYLKCFLYLLLKMLFIVFTKHTIYFDNDFKKCFEFFLILINFHFSNIKKIKILRIKNIINVI